MQKPRPLPCGAADTISKTSAFLTRTSACRPWWAVHPFPLTSLPFVPLHDLAYYGGEENEQPKAEDDAEPVHG